MSQISIDGINCHYEVYGDSGKDVILLHGWGQNLEMMAYIGTFLAKHFKVYNLDLPGHGQSDEPNVPFDGYLYSEWLHKFVETLNIENPILIGHSNGARIALNYAYKYPVNKMCLTGAAGIRPKHGVVWYFKTYSYKLMKKVLSIKPLRPLYDKYQNKVGSEDYKNSSGIMRQTFVKIVNSDIKDKLKDINTETLLVFGENDEATPLYMGKMMEKLMPDCALVIFENDDHYAYFHQADRFNLVLDAFLKRDYHD